MNPFTKPQIRWAGWTAAAVCGTAMTLLAGEKVPYLGVEVMPLMNVVRHQLKLLMGAGLSVLHVAPDSPAAEAGVQRHDILQKLDDQWLYQPAQLAALVRGYGAGRKIPLTLLRDGEPRTLTVTLGEREVPEGTAEGEEAFPGMMVGSMDFSGIMKRIPPEALDEMLKNLPAELRGQWECEPPEGKTMSLGRADLNSPPAPFLGVVPEEPDEALLAQLGRDANKGGVVIREVTPESPAFHAGLQPNDLIVALDGQPVRDPAALSRAIRRHKQGDTVALKYLRQGRAKEVRIKLGAWKTARIETLLCPVTEDDVTGAQTSQNITIIGGEKNGKQVVIKGITIPDSKAKAPSCMVGAEISLPDDLSGGGNVTTAVVFQDEKGSVTLSGEPGNRHAVVKDPDGKVLYDGKVGGSRAWKQASSEVRERVQKVERVLEKLPLKETLPSNKKIEELFVVPPVAPGFIQHETPASVMPPEPETAGI